MESKKKTSQATEERLDCQNFEIKFGPHIDEIRAIFIGVTIHLVS